MMAAALIAMAPLLTSSFSSPSDSLIQGVVSSQESRDNATCNYHLDVVIFGTPACHFTDALRKRYFYGEPSESVG